MLATIKKYGSGRCLISGTQTEGVEVEFADGTIRGFVSLKELTKLLKARTNDGNNAATDQPLFDQPHR